MLKKILIGFAILFGLLILSVIILVASIGHANKPKASNEKVLKGKDGASKKALIIYQPAISATTSEIANAIAKGLNDGGYEVTLNYPSKNISSDISKYSIVVFGSPVYAGKPLSIVTDYMSGIKDFDSKKIVLFSTGADSSNKSELDEMEKALNGAKPYKKVKFKSGSKKESKDEAYTLGKDLSKE